MVKIYPPVDDAPPKYLPSKVERAYVEAVKIIGLAPDPAGMAFRKTLEIALSHLRPSDKGNLKSRIDNAAEESAITKELAEWAHRIRLDGNEAAHGSEPLSREEVDELHHFTELVLMYLFTLPGMLNEWRIAKG